MTSSNRVLTGTLLNITPDVPNVNGRIYPRALLEKITVEYRKKIDNDTALGELYYGEDIEQMPYVQLHNVSHRITKLEVTADAVRVEAELLSTPMGKIADTMFVETPMFIARAIGTIENNVIGDDLQLIAIDIGNPKDAN